MSGILLGRANPPGNRATHNSNTSGPVPARDGNPPGPAQANNNAPNSGGYVPHYLQPGGEGAVFYLTLPQPWNVTPEHTATPLTQLPGMQKAGFFSDFTGEVQNYRTFRASFIDLCHKLDVPISSKYLILKHCLAKHAVLSDLLNTTTPSFSGYRTIIVTLEERYGHTDVLLAHHLQRLNELPKVRETVVEDFELLVDLVRGYEAARPDNGTGGSQDPTFFNLVKNKLTDRQRREYARYTQEQGIPQGSCNISDLMFWIKVHLAEPLRLEPPTKKSDNPAKKTGIGHTSTHKSLVHAATPQSHGSGHQPGPLNLERTNRYQFHAATNGCQLCRDQHQLEHCPEFLGYPLNKRFDLLKRLNVCFKCLAAPHMANECSAPPCSKCKQSHHTIMHYNRNKNSSLRGTKQVKFAAPMSQSSNFTPIDNPDYMYTTQEFLNHARQTSSNKEFTNYLFMLKSEAPVSLFFQWVKVVNPKTGLTVECNLMQDPGAQFTAISEQLSHELLLRGASRDDTIVGVGGHRNQVRTLHTEIIIISNNGMLRQTIAVRTLRNPVGNLRAVDWNLFKHYWPHLAGIQFPTPVRKGRVDIILGMDYPTVVSTSHTKESTTVQSSSTIPSGNI